MTRSAEIAKARKIDTQLAELWEEFWTVELPMRQIAKDIKSLAGRANMKHNQTEARQAEYAARIAGMEAKLDEMRPVREEKRQAAIDFDEANYTGWNRFFLVQHIHSNRYCSSFRPTTRVGWLPSVSGLTEAEAVAEHGATLCTICFPSAPVELTTAKVDDSVCPGSGRGYSTSHKTGREHSYYGKSGFCQVCDTRQVVTATGAIRKHKKA
jgi:hypothetical protein